MNTFDSLAIEPGQGTPQDAPGAPVGSDVELVGDVDTIDDLAERRHLTDLRRRRDEAAQALAQEQEQGTLALQAAVEAGDLQGLLEREGRISSLRQVVTTLEGQIETAQIEAEAAEARIERAELVSRLAALAQEGSRAVAQYDALCIEAGHALEQLMRRLLEAHSGILQAKQDFVAVASRAVPDVARPRNVLERTGRLAEADALIAEVRAQADLTALSLPWGALIPCSFESFSARTSAPESLWGAAFLKLFYEHRTSLLAEQGQRLRYQFLQSNR